MCIEVVILTLGTDWEFQGETASEGISYNIIGNEVSVTAIDTSVNRGYIDLDIEISNPTLVVTKRFSISKSKDGSTGDNGGNTATIYLYKRSASTPSWDGGTGFTYGFYK